MDIDVHGDRDRTVGLSGLDLCVMTPYLGYLSWRTDAQHLVGYLCSLLGQAISSRMIG